MVETQVDSPIDALTRPEAAVYTVDTSGRIVSWSEAAEALLGWKRDDVLGRFCYELLRGEDTFGNRYCVARCPIRCAVGAGVEPEPFVVLVRSTDGEQVARIRVCALPEPGPGYTNLVHIVERGGEEEVRSLVTTLRAAARRGRSGPPAPPASNPLTRREQEIVQLLSDGLPPSRIASSLTLSRATVRNHIQNILRKLDVHGQVEAVAVAFRSGWL